MDQAAKDQVLEDARAHLHLTREHITERIAQTRQGTAGSTEEMRSLALEAESEEIRMLQSAVLERNRMTAEDLEKLLPSPYFTRCDIKFEDEAEARPYYFAKFSFAEDAIYSWTTPVASLRYDTPGPVAYATPEDGKRRGTMLRKDQFMIVDDTIVFLATEGLDTPRALVHQEYLSMKRGSFALPEIVAQMEKAQDQVIRAHHVGPFAISGPAGSGKTTLALHRIAFLTQAPDTAKLYPGRSMLVLVQDISTQDYFSHLLPELGIHTVKISTFGSWALEMLGLSEMREVSRPGASEDVRDRYEYAKLTALRQQPAPHYRRGAEFSILQSFYSPYMDAAQLTLLAEQREAGQLDRYDLTILMRSLASKTGGFTYAQESSVRLKNGEMRLRTRMLRREYPLLLIDEFQNYLPEQLRLLNLCVKPHPGSVLYVGDIAQQTRFGSLQGWDEIGLDMAEDRSVRLQKVYRNTKAILRYIQRLGYTVEIPESLREGSEVVEQTLLKPEDEIVYIDKQSEANPGLSIGVLAKDPDYLAPHQAALSDLPQVRCMGIREAQGVEFDIVILVGKLGESGSMGDTAFEIERARIDRDLLYVALTRAMQDLHVLGELGNFSPS